MRFIILILLNLAFSTLLSAAEEKLPMLKVGSEVYSNVTVTSVTAKDIYFTYPKGMGNAKLKNLEPAMQKHFNYDPAKVATSQPATNAAIQPLTPPIRNQ
ncbi:MAG: hypothetical protein JWQ71_815 [Pedosphaera sp.]|nr:hypothetical protein [Pedosphaera sp.]